MEKEVILNNLPKIFSFLDYKDLLNLSLVSKNCKQASDTNGYWKSFVKLHFPNSTKKVKTNHKQKFKAEDDKIP